MNMHTIAKLFNSIAQCDRPLWTARILAFACLVSMLLSSKVWLSHDRFFPTLPLISGLGEITYPFDVVLFSLTCAALLGIALTKWPWKCTAIFLVLASVLAIYDQSRWQPWFYEYCLMLAALAFIGGRCGQSQSALNTCRLIVASTYIWSGIHKLNATYLTDTFGWLMGPWLSGLPPPAVTLLAFFSACFESTMGMALLNLRLRHLAIAALSAMHLLILLRIGPLGENWNPVVWPWDIAMVALLVLLFFRTSEHRALDIVEGKNWFHKLVVLLCFGAPAAHLIDKWDAYPSFALYTGDPTEAAFLFDSRTWQSVPKEIQKFGELRPDGFRLLLVLQGSLAELNVPPYSEVRAFKQMGKELAPRTDSPNQIYLLIRKRPPLWKTDREMLRFDVHDL
jgi:uncharacterized membrane protein YphA (DoxX/SURF4 family)